MNIKIECPKCKQQYSVADSFIGEEVECATCNNVFVAQKKEPIKLEKYNSSLEQQEQSGATLGSNETTTKRIQILMELQDWDKARVYCENALDSAPENPDLYLMLCLINHKFANKSLLEDSNCDLTEDKYFATAIKLSSASHKQRLLDIQSKTQQNRLQRYEFFLRKCMEKNKVTIVSMLSKSKTPLVEDFYFQKTLEFAPSEQKKMLLHLQEEQGNNTSSLKKVWIKTKEIRKGGLLGATIGISFGLIIAIVVSIVERSIDIEAILFCVAIFLSAGLVLGGILEMLWKRYYKPETKKTTIALKIILGVTFSSVVLAFIQSGIDYSGRSRLRKSVSFFEYLTGTIFDEVFLVILIVVNAFCFIWCTIWYHKEKVKRIRNVQIAQKEESEYNLWKAKRAKDKIQKNESLYDQKHISSSDISFDNTLKSLGEFHSEEENNKTKGNENSDLSCVQDSSKNANNSAFKKVYLWVSNLLVAIICFIFVIGIQVAIKSIHKTKYGDLIIGVAIFLVILIVLISYGVSKIKNKQ